MSGEPVPKLFGYHGQYLRIDVSNAIAKPVSLPANSLRRFLGGSGLGVHILLREQAATCEPLHPDAPLAFVFSPLVGSPLTTSAKFAVVSKSPLTNRINDSLASSGFALAGKKTGSDALVIVGRAARPSVLIIDDHQVRIESAEELWGLSCSQTESRLRIQYGNDVQIVTIGPAGENLVRFATISHDGRHAGRGGSGAVMGSKNLKALVVKGSRRCEWAHPTELVRLAKEISEKSFGPATAKYRELGTAANLLVFNRLHALPTRNFQQGSFENVEPLAPETLSASRDKARASCIACTIGCEHLYSLKPRDSDNASADADSHSAGSRVRLEYENLFALGPLCGIRDPNIVLNASRLCDDLGLDTISAGGTIAFAMECVERGLFPDASSLRFGDGDALLSTLEKIAYRKGIGHHLAEGSRRLAEYLGNDTIRFAPQVKGLEIPGYEPRSLQTMALGLAVGARGADHNRSGAYELDFSDQVDRHRLLPSSAIFAVETEDKAALMDSLILCKFLRGVFEDFYAASAEMLRLVTGWDVTANELRQSARRIVAAKKLFNIQAGWTPDEDTLPARMLNTPLADSPNATLTAEQLHAAITAYNQARGWTADGHLPDTLVADILA